MKLAFNKRRSPIQVDEKVSGRELPWVVVEVIFDCLLADLVTSQAILMFTQYETEVRTSAMFPEFVRKTEKNSRVRN